MNAGRRVDYSTGQKFSPGYFRVREIAWCGGKVVLRGGLAGWAGSGSAGKGELQAWCGRREENAVIPG